MADNTALNAGSGGDTLRTEEKPSLSAKVPVSLIDVGGTADSESIIGDSGVTMPVGGLSAENAAVSGNPVLIGGRYDASPRTLGDGDAGAIALDADGAIHISDGGNTITVDGTVTANLSATDNAVLDSIDTAVNGTLTVGSHAVTNAGAFAVQVDGTALTRLTDIETNTNYGAVTGGGVEASALRVTIANDSTGVVSVDDGGSSLTVDNADITTIAGAVSGSEMQVDIVGSLPTGSATIGSINTVFTCNTLTGGGVAHGSADSSNPHKIGAKAVTSITDQTLVDDDDRTDLYAGEDGVLITRPHCHLSDVVSEVDTNTDGASTAFASGLAAPGAGIRIYLTKATISNSSSSFRTVDIRDGAAGAVLWTLPVPAEGGVTHTFEPPIPLTANTAVAYDASAATTTLTIAVAGFTSKV